MKILIKWIIILCVLVAAVWAVFLWQQKESAFKAEYITVPMYKTNLRITIDATGTVEPAEPLVDVGAQVTGKILELGKDQDGNEVSFGSEVKEGQLLARIDDELVSRDIRRAEASVKQAQASILSSKANIKQSKARYGQAKADRDRAEQLGPGKALSQAAYDQYIFAEESAAAALAQSEAALSQSEANLDSAQANLEKEQRNLEYTRIYAPDDGMIINIMVSTGQTVVSSMNVANLCSIARKLDKVQVWAAVNEADIMDIAPGQPVVFRVDALPGREFKGTVNKIRPNATMTNNVVSYVIEIDADNPGRILKYYLTADVNFIVHDVKGALVVPNVALRFQPTPKMVRAGVWSAYESRRQEMLSHTHGAEYGASNKKTVIWVRDGEEFVKPIWVVAGETNGIVTDVTAVDVGTELKPKLPVVIRANVLAGEEKKVEATDQEQANRGLFTPPRMNRGGSRGGSGGGGVRR